MITDHELNPGSVPAIVSLVDLLLKMKPGVISLITLNGVRLSPQVSNYLFNNWILAVTLPVLVALISIQDVTQVESSEHLEGD